MSDAPPPPAGGFQPATPSVPGTPAEFGPRALAAIIDWAIIAIPGIVISLILSAISSVLGLIAYLGITAAWFWYIATYEGGPTGQTIGKKQMNLKVVGADGQPGIGPGPAIIRNLAKIVSALPCYIGFLFPLWDAKKEALHDKLVKERVVTA